MSPDASAALRKHLPELNSAGGLLKLFGIPLLLFLAVTAFFIAEDRGSQIWLLDGEVVIGTLGFLLARRFIRSRDDFVARFGSRAYSVAARRYLFPGLALIFAVVARMGYIPGPLVPRLWWYPYLTALGWLALVTGALLWVQSVRAFGFDNLTMLYVYFPEEGPLVQHTIYDILRHPVYGAVQRVAAGLALLNGSWFGLTCALFLALGFWGWVRLVEERELLQRFGKAYEEYRRRVPAFWPRPRDLPRFWRFLFSGK
ncbi:MAG TPA: isoprenylcysteine carboxylmethyltransferase family protein [Anaerolineales bacterium]|jgi:protein-S-isoprenylcysteine O-methyltransferase Ste14